MPRITNVSKDKVYLPNEDAVRHVFPGDTVEISDSDAKNAQVELLAAGGLILIEKKATKSNKKKSGGSKEKKAGKRKSTT